MPRDPTGSRARLNLDDPGIEILILAETAQNIQLKIDHPPGGAYLLKPGYRHHTGKSDFADTQRMPVQLRLYGKPGK